MNASKLGQGTIATKCRGSDGVSKVVGFGGFLRHGKEKQKRIMLILSFPLGFYTIIFRVTSRKPRMGLVSAMQEASVGCGVMMNHPT